MSNAAVIDLRGEAVVLAPKKWTALVRRDPSTMRGVVMHSWGTSVGTTSAVRRKYGSQRLALAHRAREAGYTISAGVDAAGDPLVVLVHPVERYTYTSDAGCRDFVSIGVFGAFAYDERKRSPVAHANSSPALTEAIDIALREAAATISAPVGPDRPRLLITHRQCCNGRRDHFACPGELVVAMALSTSAMRDDALFVADPDIVLDAKFSRAWPEHWRRHQPVARIAVCPEPVSSALVCAEHHALPLMPVGDDGSDATHDA